MRYAEAKAAFLTATEEVTMTTINYFFNLLLAKEDVYKRQLFIRKEIPVIIHQTAVCHSQWLKSVLRHLMFLRR